MRLNRIEKLLMNNPVRAFIHFHFEARHLYRLGGRIDGGTALEIGCGRGVGAQIVRDVFGADRVHAFDLDLEMVKLARLRIHGHVQNTLFWVAGARAIPTPDRAYDAVFDFGVLHHVVDWRAALKELYRVLKPGGRLYLEEILAAYITHPLVNLFLDHPQQDRFDQAMLLEAMRNCGFNIIGTDSFMGLFFWVVAAKPAIY